ncbi:MAG: hypothetical protein R3E66_16105 [bacterium]
MTQRSPRAIAEAGGVVFIHFTLKNDAGEIIDSSGTGNEPLIYLHGADNIVPGLLESELQGGKVGDKVKAVSCS